ncbi:MAG: LCCL domain-containing protein [Solirubrobacterales bacterium]
MAASALFAAKSISGRTPRQGPLPFPLTLSVPNHALLDRGETVLLEEASHASKGAAKAQGGEWLEACRRAAVDERLPNGVHLRSNVPTSCVIANANEALSWTVTALLGAGTAFIAPAGARAVVIASTGAAVAPASKGAEELLLGAVDANLNVWGIFWVVDARCGAIDTTSRLFRQTADAGGSPGTTSIGACPATGDSIRSATTCTCAPAQTGSGPVWGSGPYTSDSSICRAAVHAGVISTRGGTVEVRPVGGRRSYAASSRKGVTTTRDGSWKASFEFE